MKKLISILTALVLAATLLSGLTISVSAATASDDGGYDNILFEDGFENAVQGNTDTDQDELIEGPIYIDSEQSETWSLSMSADNKEKALHTYESADAKYGSKGLALYDESATGKKITLVPSKMAGGVKHIKYEFDVNVPNGVKRRFRYHSKAVPLIDITNGTIFLYGSSTKVSYTHGTWVNIAAVVNIDEKEIQLYVEGDLKDTLTITDTTNIPENLSYETSSATTTTTPSLLDNVKISIPSALTITSTLPANGATEVAPNATYKITGNRNLNKYDLSGMTVTDSDGANVTYTYTISGNEATVKFDSFLKLDKTYTVTLGGNSYTFTTEGEVPESNYYPQGMTWDTMQYHADGAALADSSAWTLNNIDGTNVSIEEANGNKYALVNGPETAGTYDLRYNIGVSFKDSEGYVAENRFLYYTMQIAGWEDEYDAGNLTISPRYGSLANTARTPSAPIYLATGGAITSSGGKVVAAINPIQESSSLQDKFYRVDMIINMHTGHYYVYLDGQKVIDYEEEYLAGKKTSGSTTLTYNSIDYIGISPATTYTKDGITYTRDAVRSIKLDNVGYKVYPSTDSIDTILAEVFPVDRITSLSAYALDADNAEGRRYRVVIRGSADEGAGSYIIAAYDANGKMLDVRNLNGRKNENDTSVTMGKYTREGSFVTDIVHGIGLDSLDEVKTIKAFLINTDGITPVVECATLDNSRFN